MTETRSSARSSENQSAVIRLTIEALEAWWPPTFTPDRFSRTRLAWWTIAAESHDVVRQLAERWNAGDLDGALDLYHEDAVSIAGPDWPEQYTHRGHDEIRSNMADWLSVWDSSQIEIGSVETYGDKVVVTGAWITRGRSSGVTGTMPIVILLTLRDGKIAVLEWQTDHDTAVAAARGT